LSGADYAPCGVNDGVDGCPCDEESMAGCVLCVRQKAMPYLAAAAAEDITGMMLNVGGLAIGAVGTWVARINPLVGAAVIVTGGVIAFIGWNQLGHVAAVGAAALAAAQDRCSCPGRPIQMTLEAFNVSGDLSQ